jgi:hypothetical protein
MRPEARHLDAGRADLDAARTCCRPGEEGTGEAGREPGACRRGLWGGLLHALISGRGWRAVKRRTAPVALVLLGALAATGCSGVKVVYGQLDVLVPWYLRDYVDLDAGQRSQLQRSVETLLAWHRESEVGRYAAFFRELAADAAGPLPPGRLEAARQELETFWDDIGRRLAPDAAALLSTLSDAQVESLFERMAREDDELARESARRSPEQRAARRGKSLTRQVERWTGRLDAAQRDLVAACAGELKGDTEGWLASRRAWRAALREALARRADVTGLAVSLERLFADGEDFWTPSYRDNFKADRQRVLRMLEDLDRTLTPPQRSHLRDRLERWALDLDAIAGGA